MKKELQNKIRCLICKKFYKRLNGAHIENTHNMSGNEYLKMFPGAKLYSDALREKHSKLRKKLFNKKGSDLRKKIGMRSFDFIEDKKLRMLLRRDHFYAKQCLKDKLWKPCIILYGGIIEAITLESSPEAKTYYDALKMALDKKIISESDYHKINIIRDLRNYIHLRKELKGEAEINENWAQTFADICESIIKHFKE